MKREISHLLQLFEIETRTRSLHLYQLLQLCQVEKLVGTAHYEVCSIAKFLDKKKGGKKLKIGGSDTRQKTEKKVNFLGKKKVFPRAMGTAKTTKITCPCPCPCCPKMPMPVPVPFLAGFQNHVPVPVPVPFSPKNGRAHVPLARALSALEVRLYALSFP
jgi:hypothetical protein